MFIQYAQIVHQQQPFLWANNRNVHRTEANNRRIQFAQFFLISFKYLQLEPTRQCIKSELNHWKIKYLTKRKRGKGSKSTKMRAKRCEKNLYKSRSEYTFHAIFVAFTPCAASSRKKNRVDNNGVFSHRLIISIWACKFTHFMFDLCECAVNV